jgi:hypothetical protein
LTAIGHRLSAIGQKAVPKMMREPPITLDGANVLCWVASRRGCFYRQPGSDPSITVVAMAVARYEDRGPFYLFKCDDDWQVVGDWACESIIEAKALAAEHSFGERLEWIARD